MSFYLLVERGTRVKLLAEERGHGNVRNFEKLRELLGEKVSLGARLTNHHPLNSTRRRRTLRVECATWQAVIELVVLFVGVVLDRSGGSESAVRKEAEGF